MRNRCAGWCRLAAAAACLSVWLAGGCVTDDDDHGRRLPPVTPPVQPPGPVVTRPLPPPATSGGTVQPKPPKPPAGGGATADQDALRNLPVPREEFDTMAAVARLAGNQLTTFQRAVQNYFERLDAWKDSPEGQRRAALRAELEAARRNGDARKEAAVREQLRALVPAQDRYRERQLDSVVRILTLDQQREWAAHLFWQSQGQALVRHFRKANLTPSQVEQAKSLVRLEMNQLVQPGTADRDPYFFAARAPADAIKDRLTRQVANRILTPDQRRLMGPG
jgi:hypothetical protein